MGLHSYRMMLRHRFSLALFLAGAAGLAALLTDRVYATGELLDARAASRAETLAAAGARDLHRSLVRGDKTAVQDLLRFLSEVQSVERAALVDSAGRELAAARGPAAPSGERHRFVAREPVDAGGGSPLWLEVTIHPARRRDAFAEVAGRGALWSLACLAALAFTSWRLGALAGRKLEALAAAVEKLDDGGPISLPESGSSSEIGTLSRSFAELRRRLRLAAEERRRLESQRDDMINMLVHDMKQPMTVFRVSLAMLEDPGERPQERVGEALAIARRGLTRLESMIDGVLQSACLQRGATPRKRRIALARFLQECAEEDGLVLRGAGRPWRLTMAPEIQGRWIFAHRPMLRRLLGNLLLNALDHSPDGSPVSMSAHLTRDGGSVEVAIENEAPQGSAPVFDTPAYTSGEESSHAGLGLAFCRMAARWHGGRFAGRLEDGRVIFALTLPLGGVEASPLPLESPAA